MLTSHPKEPFKIKYGVYLIHDCCYFDVSGSERKSTKSTKEYVSKELVLQILFQKFLIYALLIKVILHISVNKVFGMCFVIPVYVFK